MHGGPIGNLVILGSLLTPCLVRELPDSKRLAFKPYFCNYRNIIYDDSAKSYGASRKVRGHVLRDGNRSQASHHAVAAFGPP